MLLRTTHQKNTLSRMLEAKRKFSTSQTASTPADFVKENLNNAKETLKDTNEKASHNTDNTQVGAFLRQAELMFSSMKSKSTLECLSRARRAFSNESRMNKKSSVQEILYVNNQFVVCLLEHGRCAIHQICKSHPLHSNTVIVFDRDKASTFLQQER